MGLSIRCIGNDNPDCINRNIKEKKNSFEAALRIYFSPASERGRSKCETHVRWKGCKNSGRRVALAINFFFTAAHASRIFRRLLTLILLTWRIWWVPNNTGRWDLIREFKRLNFSKISAVLYSPTSSPTLLVYTQMASVTTQLSSEHRNTKGTCVLCTSTQNSLCLAAKVLLSLSAKVKEGRAVPLHATKAHGGAEL